MGRVAVGRAVAGEPVLRLRAVRLRRCRRRRPWSLLLLLPALCVLASCGIPATGVVEAGGPASGIVPTIRIYFVADGALVGVPRGTVAPVDVESAVDVLLLGPTVAEESKRLTTLLPSTRLLLTPVPTASPTDLATATATEDPQGAAPASDTDLVRVTTENHRVSIELLSGDGELADLAAAQLICTALGVQRVASPGAEPRPVTVTSPDGRRVEGTDVDCPDE